MKDAKFLLIYHIIFVVKYRNKLLKQYGNSIKQFIFKIAKKSDFDIQEMAVDKDHIQNSKDGFGKRKPFGAMDIFVAPWVMHRLKP